jgi:endothelin-converting enzyme/putative endopeptidase
MKILNWLLAAIMSSATFAGLAWAQQITTAPAEHGIFLSDLDTKAAPCTDFFEFANGSWRATNPIPPEMNRWSRRWKADELSKEQLKGVLDEVSKQTGAPAGSSQRLIGDYYASCMDEAAINKRGIEPIRPWLRQIDAMKSRADLQNMILEMHQYGVLVPFGITSEPDHHDPENVIANVFASGLGLPDRDYYLKPKQRFKDARTKYIAHVQKMFELAGYKPDEASTASAVVMRMETKLAKASLDNVALRDPHNTDHKTSFAELTGLVSNFEWNRYFEQQGLPKANLNVDQPKFMQEVNRQIAEEPLTNWKTYLKWQVMNNTAADLSDPFVNEDFAFNGAYLAGKKEIKPRWKRCVESADELLGDALGQEYVKRHFTPEAKSRAQEMVKNILAAMGDTIRDVDWMSPETKQKALEKLASIHPKVGYPDRWMDYEGVKIVRADYFASVLSARRYATKDDFSQAGKPLQRWRWGITPPTSNAYNDPLMNEIVFPAGILQPPTFDITATDAVNYGSIGVVIGHEISHGFDDQGAQYDAKGRLENWWTAQDKKKFEAKAQCVADQFESYYIGPTIHHNGKLVLEESIGDLAGAKISYRAFKKTQEGKPPAPTIDGFTPDQQFFIAWGQWRGDEIRPKTQRLMVQGGPHPIAKYRVIGPLSNLPEFQRAFQCKQGAAMVRPEGKRCEVW